MFVRLPYLSVKVSKDQHVVLFPNNDGKIYLLKKLSPQLQRKAEREKYLKANGIQPLAQFSVGDDGILDIFHEGVLPDQAILVKGKKLLEAQYPLTYLLAYGFVTKDLALAMMTSAVFTSQSGDLPVTEAKMLSDYALHDHLAGQQQKLQDWMNGGRNPVLSGTIDSVAKSIETPETVDTTAIDESKSK